MTHRRDTKLRYANDGRWIALLISAFGIFACIYGVPAVEAAGPDPTLEPYRQTIEKNGIRINFEVAHIGDPTEQRNSFQEGDPVLFRFAINDTTTNAPIQGVFPDAWLDLRRKDEIPAANSCDIKAQKFITGGLFAQAALDLNDYYVLALNDDPTISVVDPLFGLGTT